MDFAYIGYQSEFYRSLHEHFSCKNDQLRLYRTLDMIVAESFTNHFDAIILDFDTYSAEYILRIIQFLKLFNPEIPFFILMSNYATETAETMFAMGITDCYQKPSEIEEIVIRIRNFSFNTVINKHLSQIHISEGYVYNTIFSTLYYQNEKQKFTKNETALLRLLIENKERFITHDEIVSYVYQDRISIEDTAIRSLVSRLRKKLKEDFIESGHGQGYRIKLFSNLAQSI